MRFGGKSGFFGETSLWVGQFWKKAIGVPRAPFETDRRTYGGARGGQIKRLAAAIKETE